MKDSIEQNNEMIAIFMGGKWYEPVQDEFARILEIPHRIGGAYTHLNQLEYHESWDWLIPVVEKINATHENGIEGRDLQYTIGYLLGGGYRFVSYYRHPVYLTLENLWTRIVEFIKSYNQENKNDSNTL